MCKVVQQAFEQGSFPENFNNTLTVLIPKIDKLENFSHFRPISLCNVIYKIITKVIATRMKLVLNKLIEEGQSSFVPNRNITDSIILAQEVAHTM